MMLEELFPDLKMEDYHLEVKAKMDDSDDKNPKYYLDENGEKRRAIRSIPEWLKTVAGFSNYEGGTLLFGVKDDFTLIGFERKELDAIRNKMNNMINEHLSPRPTTKITFVSYPIKGKERFIIRVDVDSSEVRPVLLKFNQLASIFMRRDGFTGLATYEEIINLSIHSKNTSYDRQISDVIYQSNDFTDLQNLHKKYSDNSLLTDKKLQSMGFFDDKGYLSNGAVLFKDNYDGDKTTVHCNLFSGLTRGDDRIITTYKFTDNIPNSIERIMEFVAQRENHSFIKQPMGRIDIDSYPKRALQEGVINAIAHRDYYIDGAQIQIDMFQNRLEISSPGSFLSGGRIEKTHDLSSIISQRRNELICNVLVSCNLMEASGTGYEKIIDAYKDQDFNHQPYVFSSPIQFTLVLPDVTYELGISNSDIPELIIVDSQKLSENEKKILSFSFRKGRSTKEIAEYLGIGNSTYFRNEILKKLVDADYLIKTKEGKSFVYKTNDKMISLK